MCNSNTTCSISVSSPVCSVTTGNTYTSTVTSVPTQRSSVLGDGTIIGGTTGSSVTVTAGAAGGFTLRENILLKGRDGQCTKTVTVNANPTCSIKGSTPVCSGTTGKTYTSTDTTGATRYSAIN